MAFAMCVDAQCKPEFSPNNQARKKQMKDRRGNCRLLSHRKWAAGSGHLVLLPQQVGFLWRRCAGMLAAPTAATSLRLGACKENHMQ